MIVATGNAPKRPYGEREILPRRCKKCGTRGRVTGRARDRSGKPLRTRYVQCPKDGCGERWNQTPDD